jgi:hypothetical protein
MTRMEIVKKASVTTPVATKSGAKPASKRPSAAPGRTGLPAKTLPGAPKGKVSRAKPALGDAPVSAYIATLPPAQRAIAKHFDALVAKTIPAVQRCIKWGMPFYGNDLGWFVSCGAFSDHVKITFLQGVMLKPPPPTGAGKWIRGVDVRKEADLNDRALAVWIKQASVLPGFGAGAKAK